MPRLRRARSISVLGYTDSIGSKRYNLRLSRRRATSVRSYLAAHVHHSVRYRARGLGERGPVAPNRIGGRDNPNGRRQNRRVVISYRNR